MKNNKAQESIGNIIAIVLILLALVSAIAFLSAFRNVGPATVTSATCHKALVSAYGVGDFINSHKFKTHSAWDYLTILSADTATGAALGSVAPTGVTTLVGAGIGFFVGLGADSVLAINDWVKGSVNNGMDAVKDAMQNSLKKMCVTSPYSCTGSADKVANCIYKRATSTYYTLLGGYDHAYTGFNLYTISVKVDNPGDIMLKKGCSNYIHTGSSYANSYKCPDGLNNYGICWNDAQDENGEDACEIEFTEVNRFTMELSMISKCQYAEDGPNDYTCKCFAKPGFGYSPTNGLPESLFYPHGVSTSDGYGAYFSDVFKNIPRTAEYYDEDGNIYKDVNGDDTYKGCGYNAPYYDETYDISDWMSGGSIGSGVSGLISGTTRQVEWSASGFESHAYELTDDGVKIGNDMIVFNVGKGISVGSEMTLSIKLNNKNTVLIEEET